MKDVEADKELLVKAAQIAGVEDNPFWQAVETELDKTQPPAVEPRKLRET